MNLKQLVRKNVFQKMFTTSKQKLPQDLKEQLTVDAFMTKYKSAGTMSNQRSAAATAWLVEHHSQLENIGYAQAGLFCGLGDCILPL